MHRVSLGANLVALDWCRRYDQSFCIGVATSNVHGQDVEVIRFDKEQGFRPFHINGITNRVPASALAFFPSKSCYEPDLLACGSDTLSIWRSRGVFLQRVSELYVPPLRRNEVVTSIDWNDRILQWIATVSSRGSCRVWDIERELCLRENLRTIGFPHPPLVTNVSWGYGHLMYAAGFLGGEVHLFDLREGGFQEIFRGVSAVTKVEWSPTNMFQLAVAADNAVTVLDIRARPLPIFEHTCEHEAVVKSFAWDPIDRNRLCFGGMDSQAVMWEIPAAEGAEYEIRRYIAGGPIEDIKWSTSQPRWAALGFNNQLQIMEVRNGRGGITF